MDEFGKFFPHYMAGSLEKYYSDFDDMGIHEVKKKRVTFCEGQYMEIDEFVQEYLQGYLCFKEGNVKVLTHAALKKLTGGNLVGIDNDFVFYNQQYITNEYLIVVRDKNGDFGTYLNPELLDEYIKTDAIKELIKKMKKTVLHDLKAISEAFRNFERAVATYERHAEFYEQMDKLITATKKKHKVKQLKGEKNNNDKH